MNTTETYFRVVYYTMAGCRHKDFHGSTAQTDAQAFYDRHVKRHPEYQGCSWSNTSIHRFGPPPEVDKDRVRDASQWIYNDLIDRLYEDADLDELTDMIPDEICWWEDASEEVLTDEEEDAVSAKVHELLTLAVARMNGEG